MKKQPEIKKTSAALKAVAIAFKASVYSYRMAKLERSFENIIGMEDDLTGLPNRRAFNEHVKGKGISALALIDCDSFKMINDTCGHDRGDEVLRMLGAILKDQDVYAVRLGGDEFVVVFDSDAKIIGVLEDIRNKAKAWTGVTLSVGVCMESGNAHEMMKKADVALYRSKEAGRDTISFWNFTGLVPAPATCQREAMSV